MPEGRSHVRTVVVADDLTGAADMGAALLASSPSDVCVVARWHDDTEAALDLIVGESAPDILCVSTDSRNGSAHAAHARVARVMDWIGPRPVRRVKKIDSLLRGHVAAEVDAFLALPGGTRRPALVAAALPSQGRTTRDGVQLADGTPVHLSESSDDPLAPTRTSRLADLMPGDVAVTHAPRDEVNDDRLAARLRSAALGQGVTIVDAVDEADMTVISRAAAGAHDLAIIATSGFRDGSAPCESTEAMPAGSRTLVLGASRRHEFAVQRDTLLAHCPHAASLTMDPDQLIDPRALGEELAGLWITRRLIVLGVDARAPLVGDAGERTQIAMTIVGSLSECGVDFLHDSGPRTLVCIGGDLAESVTRRASVHWLRVTGADRDGAVRCLLPPDPALAEARMILRSGGFGHAAALLDLCPSGCGTTDQGSGR